MSKRNIFNHDVVSRFIVGTVGMPGERAFFIQVESVIGFTTVAVEKSQVSALSVRLRELITQVRRNKLASLDELEIAALVDNEALNFPIDEEFTAGVMAIAWDVDSQRVSVEIQAVADGEFTELLGDDEVSEIEDPPDLLRFNLRLFQARGFCDRADLIVASGRTACSFCGLPIDSNGHLCPRSNGYRR